MSIYLGSKGRVELRRTGEGAVLETEITPNEVLATKKLLSIGDIDPDGLQNMGITRRLITGDQVTIRSADDSTALSFLNGTPGSKSSGTWYIHVDELGGCRLYTSFAHAVSGGTTNAVNLNSSYSATIAITMTVENANYRILGQTTSYELNTNREAVDTTALGDRIREQVSSLLSGSGRIDSFWDYRDTVGSGNYESSQYLYQLILRTALGCRFDAHFYLKPGGYTPSGDAGTSDDVIYYQVSGILTGTALAFDVANIVKVSANFVTTGEIRLVVLTAPEYAVLIEGGTHDGDDLLIDHDGTDEYKLLLESE